MRSYQKLNFARCPRIFGNIFAPEIRHQVTEAIDANDTAFPHSIRGFRPGHRELFVVFDYITHSCSLAAFGKPRGDRCKNIASVKGFADRLK